LSNDFLIKQLSHFGVRPKFLVSPSDDVDPRSGECPIVESLLFWNSFSAADSHFSQWRLAVMTQLCLIWRIAFEKS